MSKTVISCKVEKLKTRCFCLRMLVLVRKDSTAFSKTELDLLSIHSTQTAIEKGHFIYYHLLAIIFFPKEVLS